MEPTKRLSLALLPGKLGICHLNKNSEIPEWAQKEGIFSSVSRTQDELSIICPQENIPAGVLFEGEWRVFKILGPLGFTLTGVVSALSKPLSDEEISIFYISTYETDYLMVEEENVEGAKKILGKFCDIK
ncbi:MAG: ACT domain-containing protein [Candidatus Pacebacteria bacterium]|nr:ACT domain-containing protein [Candidatus Paceibacterota bacterium]